MIKFKRLAALILTFLLISFILQAYAFATDEGDFTYTVNGDGMITVMGVDQDVTGSIEIPERIDGKYVTAIGDYAFYGLSKITSVILPPKVTDIGEYAFCACTALESVVLPDMLERIGASAFASCGSLSELTFPESVITIGDYAFIWCASLTKVVLPDSIIEIGDFSFQACNALRYAEMGKSLNVMGDYSFAGCTVLASALFRGNAPESFGENVFKDASERFTIYYLEQNASSWKRGGANTYNGYAMAKYTPLPVDERFEYDKSEGGVVITAYKGGETELEIPERINGMSVCEIAPNAFRGKSLIESVKLPDSLKKIGNSAFFNCASLARVAIGASLESMGEDAFGCCGRLSMFEISSDNKNYKALSGAIYSSDMTALMLLGGGVTDGFVIPDTVVRIADKALSNCKHITVLDIPKSITEIGAMAFAGSGLRAVMLPDTVNTLGAGAFVGCETLTAAVIGSGIGAIPEAAFADCIALESIIIPDTVTNIGAEAFASCESMSALQLGSGLKSIGDSAFSACKALAGVELPGSLESIGDGVFAWCVSLAYITIPDSVTSMGEGVFESCRVLEDVTLGSGLLNIMNYTFWNCDLLREAIIPDTVTSIGERAFDSCDNLNTVTFGKNIESIASLAFSGCVSLEAAIFTGMPPKELGVDVFSGVSPDFTVYYTLENADKWQNKGQEWNGYPLRLENDDEETFEAVISPQSSLIIDREHGYLLNVPVRITAAELLANFDTENVYAYSNDGAALVPEALVGTGAVVRIGSEKTGDNLLVVVISGDVTGDGAINSRDIAALQRQLIFEMLSGEFVAACDLNDDLTLNSRDIAALQKLIIG